MLPSPAVGHEALAEDLLRQARAAGADAADVLVAEGTDFSVTVRKGEVETLKDAGSKALLLAKEAKQNVLSADVVVLERARLVLGQDDDLPGTLSEPFEHPRAPFPVAR